MSIFSRLNSISIMPIMDGLAELRYYLFCFECNSKIINNSQLICYSQGMIELHYGTHGTIPTGKNYFLIQNHMIVTKGPSPLMNWVSLLAVD